MKFPRFRKRMPLVSVVRLEGVIASGGMVRSSALNDAGIAPLIERAFSKGKPSAVALALNSPGGSPVQSSLISGRIRRLSEERKVPVFAFVEDLAASGGYWIACAADEIFVDPSSIVGSIGVISASFGFHDLLKRSGIERRVHTAGEDKSILDPFLPEKESDVSRLEELQSELHRTFIQHVTDRRGSKLSGDDLFTGKFWTGARAVDLGLADGISYLVPKMKEKFGEKVRFKTYSRRRSIFARLGTEFGGSLVESLEEKAIKAKYGA